MPDSAPPRFADSEVFLDVDKTLFRRIHMDATYAQNPKDGWSIHVFPRGNWCYWCRRPSAEAFIKALKAEGIRVSILTSAGETSIKGFLETAGISHWFAAIHGEDSVITTPTGPMVLVDDQDPKLNSGPGEKLFQITDWRKLSLAQKRGISERQQVDILLAWYFVMAPVFAPYPAFALNKPELTAEAADAHSLIGLVPKILSKLRAQQKQI